MKKIDLHIHTVPTVHDAHFTFDINILKQYVTESKLDAIAITNHNLFDAVQFAAIKEEISIAVFPGVEVSLDCGHILVICELSHLDVFQEQVEQIHSKISQSRACITIDEFIEIFPNPKEYLFIPHYNKKPAFKKDDLKRLASYIFTGEVDSAKKFIRLIKDDLNITPLLFSDARICSQLATFPSRQTFIDCGDLTLSALKACLKDKSKVYLSEAHGNKLFQIFSDGQKLSTGLNVILGARSSGKTYTLNNISAAYNNVKYIVQFQLVQQDDATYERDFNERLKKTGSQFIEDYLYEFKTVLNDVMNINLYTDDREVEKYISTLIEAAEEADKRDAYSNTALFDESEFSISEDNVLTDLIGSVRQLIENIEYRELIDKYINISSLKSLAIELIELLWQKKYENKKKKLVNGLVREIKEILKLRSSAVQVEDVDLYRVALNKKKAQRFEEIVKHLQNKATISKEEIQGFQIIATKEPFHGAGEVKKASGTKASFKESYYSYNKPYEYLQSLLANENLTPSELYKLFVNISYKILNKDGYEVSGGERSEFRLLQEIKDSQNYDMLLVDEPESSFDNIFLRSNVNQIIKEVSKTMPVVIVTHNNTVGASIKPDYILFASKEIEDGNVVYKLYSGFPTDKTLYSRDGKSTRAHDVTMNSLEAGYDAYEERRQQYETIKD